MPAHDVTAITMMMFCSVRPRIEASTIASTSHGITRNQFVTAFSTVSIREPPK